MKRSHTILHIQLCSLLALLFIVPATSAAQDDPEKSIINPKIIILTALNDTTKLKNIVLSGLQEAVDFFGRKRFIGKIINKEKDRIDFIKIEFVLRDREGKILETVSTYIKGQTPYIFSDRQISKSSLKQGETGTFDIITSTQADLVYSFDPPTITGWIFKFDYPK